MTDNQRKNLEDAREMVCSLLQDDSCAVLDCVIGILEKIFNENK